MMGLESSDSVMRGHHDIIMTSKHSTLDHLSMYIHDDFRGISWLGSHSENAKKKKKKRGGGNMLKARMDVRLAFVS